MNFGKFQNFISKTEFLRTFCILLSCGLGLGSCCIATCQLAQNDRWQSLVPKVVSSSLKWSKWTLLSTVLSSCSPVCCSELPKFAKNSPDPTHRCAAAIIYFRFFKIAPLCFDYFFAHSWHSLNELHEVATWNGFPTALKEFPEMLSTCWTFCLHSAVHLIPNHLDWV